ncbi:prephenate dehydrogenase/arogenate dehydrogenase family protein [bacterium]|nr:MAG: prephenate dehydrogenase/arogenate dehydrogenase family protein [bacterium]
MRIFNKVAIVGTGLIGGSIGLAIKDKKIARQVIGVSRHKKTLLQAKRRGAIDIGSQDIKIIKDADLVILAAPVETIIRMAPKISRMIRKDCIVTDVGSTKEHIVRSLSKIFSHYVGSHPLAGSEKRGITNARGSLFHNSLCLLAPVENTNLRALNKVRRLWQAMGSRVLLISADKHDQALSFVSHLPHVAAFALINCVPPGFLKFASGGLKDTTRIAASDAEIWTDIFSSNRRNISRSIGLFQKDIAKIKSAILNKDQRALGRLLKKAKAKREALK